jgi:hypothetical protein
MAAAQFVPEGDGAWDHERIAEECQAIRREAGWDPKSQTPDPATHPETGHIFHRYQNGLTRFDLDADGIRDYLYFDAKPEIWRLRRLTIPEQADVTAQIRGGKPDQGYWLAFVTGCTNLENPSNEAGRKLATELAADKRNPEAIRAAVEDYAREAPAEVGVAVMLASQDLQPHEKKASGVPSGEPA